MKKVNFTKALIEGQWQDDVTLTLDDHGMITAMTSGSPAPADRVSGYALPGLANVHSHAFQRAMAGLAEYRTSNSDSFWSWRDVMYRFAQKLTPEDLATIAAQLYLEMVTAGYTSVAEFHYLHHQPGGAPYDNPAEMSDAIVAAATDVGLNLTHLPVLYQASGFGGAPLSDAQARFGHTTEAYLRLWDSLAGRIKPGQNLGVAFHSLRAVTPEAIDTVTAHVPQKAPLHIHIAEQMKEVDDCLAWSGQRPVEWLLDHHPLSSRWCLVHATHLTSKETTALANTGAVAGLCPTTEANLGDGFFPLQEYLAQNGAIAIGSDSHISVSPIEEIRLLDYGQRLKYQRRNLLATPDYPHSGDRLYGQALRGGALATGQKTGVLAVGQQADIITLDPASPLLVGTPDRHLIDRFIFSGNRSPVKDVMVRGRWQVRDYTHPGACEITARFTKTMEKLVNLLD
ncbi:formimidoylglutamate deiminase [Paremcibacter congregatus]|uniref:formimidoylglutamate deiminase n=1 Tax=Paremcibacter congregatus TaxID=2043170 RepID=UPI0030EC5385